MRIAIVLLILPLLQVTNRWATFYTSDNTTIHKMSSHKNKLWGISYGNGTILKSNNQGKTWTKTSQVKADYLEKIQFINSKVGFIAGDYGYVYKSTNGGKSWTEISPNIEGRITQHFQEEKDKPDGRFVVFYDMYFKDVQKGYLQGFSYNPSQERRASTKMLFYTTIDGGENWTLTSKTKFKEFKKVTNQEIPKSKTTIGNVFYLNDSTLYQIRPIKGVKTVLSSFNGGKSWKQHSLKIQGKWTVRNIVFINNTEGYIFGGINEGEHSKAVIFKTNDSGKSWEFVENNWPSVQHALLLKNKLIVSTKMGELKSLSY